MVAKVCLTALITIYQAKKLCTHTNLFDFDSIKFALPKLDQKISVRKKMLCFIWLKVETQLLGFISLKFNSNNHKVKKTKILGLPYLSSLYDSCKKLNLSYNKSYTELMN